MQLSGGPTYPSAKALATSPAAYNAAISRGFNPSDPKTIAAIKAMPNVLPSGGPLPVAFYRLYFADPASMINQADGKPATGHEREVQFSKWAQYQLNNRKRPPGVHRPMQMYFGKAEDAYKKFAIGVAAAVGGTYLASTLLAPAAGAGSASVTSAVAPGVAAPAAAAAPTATVVGGSAASGLTITSSAAGAAATAAATAPTLLTTASGYVAAGTAALSKVIEAKQAIDAVKMAIDGPPSMPGGTLSPDPLADPSIVHAATAPKKMNPIIPILGMLALSFALN